MRILLVGLVCFLCGLLLSTALADSGAPVTVEVRYDRILSGYDCYPGVYQQESLSEMSVYLHYEDGIAGYSCVYAWGAFEMPMLPRGAYKLAQY